MNNSSIQASKQVLSDLFIIIFTEIVASCIIMLSVAKWLAYLPFTTKVAGSNFSENFLNATRTQSSCEKSKSQRSADSCGGFLRVFRFYPTGKVDRVR